MKPLKYLYPLSFVYLAAFNISQKLKKRKQKKLPRKVISVGNITTGGTGKTPTVILLAGMLRDAKKKVCVVSRGYKRKMREGGTAVVSDGKKIVVGKKLAGDEPYLIAKTLKNVPVVVDKNRYRGGLYAIENFGSDVIILDDGFQHAGLRRDLDIVCLNALDPFGGGKLLPAGHLREPVKNLKRADMFIITRCDRVPGENVLSIEKTIRRHNRKAAIFHASFAKKIFHKGKETDIESLKGKNIIAVSGLALPEDLDITLGELGGNILIHKKYPDHYYFKDRDVEEFIQSAAEFEAAILTTSKDAGRLPEDFPCYVIDVSAEIREKEDFAAAVESFIG